jgi:hypothetical protein
MTLAGGPCQDQLLSAGPCKQNIIQLTSSLFLTNEPPGGVVNPTVVIIPP